MPNYAVTVPTFKVNFFTQRQRAVQFIHRHHNREPTLWEWDGKHWCVFAYDKNGDRYVVEKKSAL